ncbi:WDR3 protein, partial [Polyodon spathula]|nr:WDR3 protein [Polyodon spathula]
MGGSFFFQPGGDSQFAGWPAWVKRPGDNPAHTVPNIDSCFVRIHFGQITSNQMLLTVMDSLRTNTISRVKKIRDVLGFNMAGLQFLQREIESKEDVTFFADATDRFEDKKRKRKKRERAILAVA